MSADVFRPEQTSRNDFRYLVEWLWTTYAVEEFLTDDWQEVRRLTTTGNEELYDVRTTDSDGTTVINPAEGYGRDTYLPTEPALLARLKR